MRLLPEKKAVLVKPRHLNRLLKIIPTARAVNYQGKQWAAVPWRYDETMMLNNMGLKVPSPMVRNYNWPRSSSIPKPFAAQEDTASFLTLNYRAFVLNDLGTGKSLAALWAYDWLRSQGKAGKLLVICPLSTMERTWSDEIFFHLPHLSYAVLHGTKQKRLKELARDVDVYILNHHGAKVILDEVSKRDDIDTIILDEVAQCARNKHDLWKAFNRIINGPIKRRAWGLTATPIPNEPTDAYWQVKLINPSKATMYYTAFRRQVMNQISQFQWIAKPDAIERVDEMMVPAIRYHRSQCIDLPPTIYMTREIPLTKEADKAYKTMYKQRVAEFEAGEITAVNEAVKASKLVQIACGVMYDEDGNEQTVDALPRMQEVEDLVVQSDAKSIVFVPFRSSVARVAQFLRDAGHKVGEVHGGVSKAARDEIFGGFQRGSSPNVIVAQPAAMSHGLTLTAASSIIWYAPVTSAETYEQANGRITRPGQKNTTLIIHIEGTPVERRIYHRLKNKQAMQNILLEKKVAKAA